MVTVVPQSTGANLVITQFKGTTHVLTLRAEQRAICYTTTVKKASMTFIVLAKAKQTTTSHYTTKEEKIYKSNFAYGFHVSGKQFQINLPAHMTVCISHTNAPNNVELGQ